MTFFLPDSKPLHYITVYQPNGDGWKEQQAHIFGYVSTEIKKSIDNDYNILVGGDWKAVQQGSDRGPQPHLNAIDKSSTMHLHTHGPTSIFGQATGGRMGAGRP